MDSIKTLFTLCYFVAGYFYEIKDLLIQQDFIKFVADLGGFYIRLHRSANFYQYPSNFSTTFMSQVLCLCKQ